LCPASISAVKTPTENSGVPAKTILILTIQAKRDNMYNSTKKGYTTATDLADYLVKKGLNCFDSLIINPLVIAINIFEI
jgi:argininosuccinate lyase